MRDLEPYVCIQDVCTEPPHMFGTSEEWLKHMQWEHDLQWRCSAPVHSPRVFDSERKFEEHLRRVHAGTFTESQLPTLKQRNLQPGSHFAICPFCDYLPEGAELNDQQGAFTSTALQVHVIDHLKSIALISLPGREDGVSDSSSESLSRTNNANISEADSDDSQLHFEETLHLKVASSDHTIPDFTVDWKHVVDDASTKPDPRLSQSQDSKLLSFRERAREHHGPFLQTYKDYTVGWICALPTELAAAVAMLDERHDPLPQSSQDTNHYELGRIGRQNVAIACFPPGVTGNASAAVVANHIRSTFPSIIFGLMVGVGSGAPSVENDIRLGDVVISKPAEKSGGMIQYDFGRTIQEGRFVRTGSLNQPPNVLLNTVARLDARHRMEAELPRHLSQMLSKHPKMQKTSAYQGAQQDHLFEEDYLHQAGQATCANCDIGRLITRPDREDESPTIHYGLIASGNLVMKDGVARERLRKELDVLCIEMEAAGLMDNFPCLVIRGICDYADTHKNNRWQPYAAAAAAAYAKELLCIIPGQMDAHAQVTTAISARIGELTLLMFTAYAHRR